MDSASKERFIQMINRHLGIINSLCSVYYQQKEDQNDTRQDIILQLWKSFPTFRNESKVSTWIYKVGINTILSKIRKEKKLPENVSLDNSTLLATLTPPQVDDSLQLFKQIIQTLKYLDRAIIILHLEGYQNKEIAAMLHLTATNVSTRMNRIKTELKEKYKSGHYEFR